MLRRIFLTGSAGTGLALALGRMTGAARAVGAEQQPGEDGLYHQPWFLESFLDLAEDLNETAAAGKRLAIVWDQRGCPYCKEMHLVNFGDAEITKYVRDNFNVIQLNLHGAREVTDFDGQVATEKELARKWGIVFTPTILYYPETVAEVAGKPGGRADVMRMPGYFRPFHFLSMFAFVRERRYVDTQFQAYIAERAERLRQQGKEIKVW